MPNPDSRRTDRAGPELRDDELDNHGKTVGVEEVARVRKSWTARRRSCSRRRRPGRSDALKEATMTQIAEYSTKQPPRRHFARRVFRISTSPVESGRRQRSSALHPSPPRPRRPTSAGWECASRSRPMACLLRERARRRGRGRSAHPELFAYGRYYLRRAFRRDGKLRPPGEHAARRARGGPGEKRKPPPSARRARTDIAARLCLSRPPAFETSSLAEPGLLPGSRFTSDEAVWKTAAFRAEHPDAARYAETFRLASLPAGRARASRGPRRPARERR